MKQKKNHSSRSYHRRSRSRVSNYNRSNREQSNIDRNEQDENNTNIKLSFSEDIIPSATLLQEYEYATSGAADRILDMVLEEQNLRHRRIQANDNFNKKTIRIAQLFGFIIFMTIIIESYLMIMAGREQFGFILFFGTMIAALIGSISFALLLKEQRLIKNKNFSEAKINNDAESVPANSNNDYRGQGRRRPYYRKRYK